MQAEPDFEIKQGATWPQMYLSVADANGLLPLPAAMDVRLYLRRGAVSFEAELEILDPPVPDPDDPDGLPFNARHTFTADQTLTAGWLQTEVKVTLGPGRIAKVPEFKGPMVRVNPALAA